MNDHLLNHIFRNIILILVTIVVMTGLSMLYVFSDPRQGQIYDFTIDADGLVELKEMN
jgi:hypothetical protein